MKKPKGLDAFERLLKPLSHVKKTELDREVAKAKKRARKRKK